MFIVRILFLGSAFFLASSWGQESEEDWVPVHGSAPTALYPVNPPPANVITQEQLFANPHLFHQVLNDGLETKNLELLGALLPLYRDYPQRDPFLAHYVEAYIAREEGDFASAIQHFQTLVDEQPQSVALRFQLAQMFFANRRDVEARMALEALQNDAEVTGDYRESVDKLLIALDKRSDWDFSGQASYQHDSNINDAPAVSEHNGWKFAEPRSASGVNVYLSASKETPLRNGFFIPLSASANLDWWWSEHDFDDLNLRAQTGLGWRNADHEIKIEPYVSRRIFGDKGYSTGYGLASSYRYNINQQWQARFYNQTGYEKHDHRKHLDGLRFSLGTSVIYQASDDLYYFAGLNHYRFKARDADDRYQNYGVNVGLGKKWENGFNTNFSASYTHRKYDGADFFNIVRKDNAYRFRLGISHEKIAWKGFEPLLVIETERTNSNHFYYDKPFNTQAHIEVLKKF